MTLGKGHLMATIPLFVAAIGYNIWYFAKSGDVAPVRTAQSAPAGAQAAGPSVAGEAAAVDPTQIPPAPDVALDKLPQWRRNPFASAQSAASSAVAGGETVEDAAQPAAEQDIVVSVILVSSDRRRATVNGQNVKVGDRVGTSTIVEIQPEAIVVESPTQGRRTIAPQRRASAAPTPPAGKASR